MRNGPQKGCGSRATESNQSHDTAPQTTVSSNILCYSAVLFHLVSFPFLVVLYICIYLFCLSGDHFSDLAYL